MSDGRTRCTRVPQPALHSPQHQGRENRLPAPGTSSFHEQCAVSSANGTPDGSRDFCATASTSRVTSFDQTRTVFYVRELSRYHGTPSQPHETSDKSPRDRSHRRFPPSSNDNARSNTTQLPGESGQRCAEQLAGC